MHFISELKGSIICDICCIIMPLIIDVQCLSIFTNIREHIILLKFNTTTEKAKIFNVGENLSKRKTTVLYINVFSLSVQNIKISPINYACKMF